MRAALIFMNICAKSSLTNQLTTIFGQSQCPIIALCRSTPECQKQLFRYNSSLPQSEFDQANNKLGNLILSKLNI